MPIMCYTRVQNNLLFSRRNEVRACLVQMP